MLRLPGFAAGLRLMSDIRGPPCCVRDRLLSAQAGRTGESQENRVIRTAPTGRLVMRAVLLWTIHAMTHHDMPVRQSRTATSPTCEQCDPGTWKWRVSRSPCLKY